MKLKVKFLSLDAGRPIAFLHEKDTEKFNAHVGDRISLSSDGKKIIVIIDITKGIINEGEIGFSREIARYFDKKIKNVEVGLTLMPRSIGYIIKKINGKKLMKEEIEEIVNDIVKNALSEAEIAYFISGVYHNGMTDEEIINLTKAVYKTGKVLRLKGKIVDKHSIGGVAGNRTSPIVVSICAAAGLKMPKTSSRAITSAAGTADVVESIAEVDFSVGEIERIVKQTGACLVWGGGLGIAPADDKLIQVERMLNLDPEPQLIASILAKKLAVGSKYILIDIPYGKGAKVNRNEAERLKRIFIKIGKHFNLKIRVVLTDGSQPIGNGIGPMLEIKDIIKVLRREDGPKDLEKKSIFLAGEILEMMGKAGKRKGKKSALKILESGKAFEKFKEIIKAQKGDINRIRESKFRKDIFANKSGIIREIDNRKINTLGRILGSPADKAAGIYLHKHVGDRIRKGGIIMSLYSESERKIDEGIKFLEGKAVVIG